MSRKKTAKRGKKIFLKVLALAAIWILVICIFVVAVFSYGMRQAVSFYAVKFSSEAKIISDSADKTDLQTADFGAKQTALFSKAESYITENFISIAKENNAGDDKTAIENICFINIDRALIFYRSNDKDRYLAELVFKEDNGRVKIDRFILKVKNDNDYSNGLYGAD